MFFLAELFFFYLCLLLFKYPELVKLKFPKVGTKNPEVRLFVFDAEKRKPDGEVMPPPEVVEAFDGEHMLSQADWVSVGKQEKNYVVFFLQKCMKLYCLIWNTVM